MWKDSLVHLQNCDIGCLQQKRKVPLFGFHEVDL